MKKTILAGLSVVTCLTICVVVIYAQISNNPSVPPVEVNARFSSADQNGDGVLSKEEFANYLVKIKQIKSAAEGTVKICPETGLPCEHDDASANASDCCGDKDKAADAKKVDGEKDCCGDKGKTKTADTKKADGEKGCCSEGKNAETVPVKFSNEGEAKKSGCCGDKDKAKTADTKKADGEKGCCGGKDKAKTADSQKADGEKGCCGGKDKAKTADTKKADGEKGCCGGKDKAKTTDAKKADGEKGCCGDKSKEAKKETNSADELTVTDSMNPVTVEKTEAETKTPEVNETNSNDKQ
ncbi:MAG: hypothetical protein LBC02_00160 [Planctomycetaceae bacterium]|nr:hypothetical protein [Planctomycetaceae bacterium]